MPQSKVCARAWYGQGAKRARESVELGARERGSEGARERGSEGSSERATVCCQRISKVEGVSERASERASEREQRRFVANGFPKWSVCVYVCACMCVCVHVWSSAAVCDAVAPEKKNAALYVRCRRHGAGHHRHSRLSATEPFLLHHRRKHSGPSSSWSSRESQHTSRSREPCLCIAKAKGVE
jgi:hypothetical protein